MPDPFTIQDRRYARSMHISLDAGAPVEHDAVMERLYDSLAQAYMRLDHECAEAHRAERMALKRLKLAVMLLAGACGLVLGMSWVLWRML